MFVNKTVIKKILHIKYCSKMYVAFRKEYSFMYLKKYYVYEMQMNGLGERKLLMDDLIGPKISMCYHRDSKTLFVSAENTNSILLHSAEGLHPLAFISV